MYGTDTKKMDDSIYTVVGELYLKYKKSWERELQNSTDKHISLHFVRDLSYLDIKQTVETFGYSGEHIGTQTDKGKLKLNKTDGGIIYIKITTDDKVIKLPIIWVETKSSNSCTTNKGERGQAVGLITEQAGRCANWIYPIIRNDRQLYKPMVAIILGTDFNIDKGIYNIDRIRLDLNSVGNIDPYLESALKPKKEGVTWFYFQEKMSNDEISKIIFNAININVNKLKPILSDIDTFIL